jgi:hypothetical protein
MYKTEIVKNWLSIYDKQRKNLIVSSFVNKPTIRNGTTNTTIKKNVDAVIKTCYFMKDAQIKSLCSQIVENIKIGLVNWKEQPQTPILPFRYKLHREKDTNTYNTIDKRQKFVSLCLVDIAKRLYTTGKLSKNQFVNVLKFVEGKKDFISEDTRQKISLFLKSLTPHKTKQQSHTNVYTTSLGGGISYVAVKQAPKRKKPVYVQEMAYNGLIYRIKTKTSQTIPKSEFMRKLKADNKFI